MKKKWIEATTVKIFPLVIFSVVFICLAFIFLNSRVVTPEKNLLTFAAKVLKKPYIPNKLNLKKTKRGEDLTWYRDEREINPDTILVFHYDQGLDGKEHTKFIEIKEFNDHKNANLDTVLGVFNKYLVMPDIPKSAWKRTDYGSDFVVYQYVFDNPDGSYDGRTSAIVTDKNGKKAIYIDACHVTTANKDWANHTCVGQ